MEAIEHLPIVRFARCAIVSFLSGVEIDITGEEARLGTIVWSGLRRQDNGNAYGLFDRMVKGRDLGLSVVPCRCVAVRTRDGRFRRLNDVPKSELSNILVRTERTGTEARRATGIPLSAVLSVHTMERQTSLLPPYLVMRTGDAPSTSCRIECGHQKGKRNETVLAPKQRSSKNSFRQWRGRVLGYQESSHGRFNQLRDRTTVYLEPLVHMNQESNHARRPATTEPSPNYSAPWPDHICRPILDSADGCHQTSE